jgi:ankyrin repeat protein
MSSLYKKIKQHSVRNIIRKEEEKLDLVNRVFHAIDNDDYDLFTRALKKTKTSIDLSFENPYGWSPLMRAVYLKRKQMVYDLLARGCNPYHQSSDDGWNSIMCAVDVQDDVIMDELLKHDGDLDLKTEKGSTALSLAASRRNFNIVASLLKAGASVDEVSGRNHFRTAILVASNKGRLSNVKEILKYKPDLNFSMGANGITPLMAAVVKENFEIVKLLLQQDTVDINLKTESGEDALQCAIDKLNSQIIVLLIASGAKLSNKSQVDEHFEEQGLKIYRLTWGRIPPVPMDSPELF